MSEGSTLTADAGLAEIEAAEAAGDRNLAISLAIAAMGRQVDHPLVLRLVAAGMDEDGRPEDAASLLHRATVLAPEDPRTHLNFSKQLTKVHLPEDALKALRRASALTLDDVAFHMDAGRQALVLGQVAASRRHFGRAAELAPGDPEPISALAVVAARQGDAQTARNLGERALALRPDFVGAQIAVARAELSEGAREAAKTRLEKLLARRDLVDEQRADALSFLGDTFDSLDLTTDAFAAYNARKAILVRDRTVGLPEGALERDVKVVRRLRSWFTTARRDALA